MKKGKSLTELAEILTEVKDQSRDFIVPNQLVRMKEATPTIAPRTEVIDKMTGAIEIPEGEGSTIPVLEFEDGSPGGSTTYPLTNWAHGQLAGHLDIPRAYYNRVRSQSPELLSRMVNHGFDIGNGSDRMIRTVAGRARAVLSSRYRVLDCHDLLLQVLPVFHDNNLQVVTAELTERRMYIKASIPGLEAAIRKGDEVGSGIVISSSDVGSGSVRVEPIVIRKICINGMIGETALRKYHVGRDLSQDELIRELLSDKTKRLDDAAFWAKVVDVVTSSLDPKIFEAQVNKLREADGQKVTNFDIPKVVKLAARSVGVSGEQTLNEAVAYLANGADGAGLTKWGLANAFTFAAQKVESFDESIELERAGAKIIDLTRNQWEEVAA